MITAKFGSKNFEVTNKKIYTPDSLSYSEELNVEEVEIEGKKPNVNIKGLKLKELSFNVSLDARFVNVESEIDFWDSKMLSKKSENFSLGNKTLGKFYLVKVNKSDIDIAKNGRYTKAKLQLTFKEDGANRNNELFPPPKVTEVIQSANTTVNKNITKGTKIKPKAGVRWYYTAAGAIGRTGKSGAAYNKVMEVTYVYQNGKAINPGGLGWLIPSDVDVV